MSTPNHDALRDLSGLYVIGALSGDERAFFETHLASCPECRDEVRSLEPVVDGLAVAVPLREPPQGLRARVLERIGAPGAGTVMPSGAAQKPRMHPAWLAAAASLLCAVALGYTTLDRQRRIAVLEARLEEVTLRANAAQIEIADVRRTAGEAQSSLAVLMAPDVARVDLAGQPVAPRASGRAFWSRSRGLVFTASNLPALPAGKVYQLWVVTAQAPVSAGLLRPDATGSVTATISTPQDLASPVAMAVTIEPEGGVPAPTGDKFLVGTPAAAL